MLPILAVEVFLGYGSVDVTKAKGSETMILDRRTTTAALAIGGLVFLGYRGHDVSASIAAVAAAMCAANAYQRTKEGEQNATRRSNDGEAQKRNTDGS